MGDCGKLGQGLLNVTTTPIDPITGAPASDAELALIQEKVEPWLGNVDDPPAFTALIDGFQTCAAPGATKTLDLISHAVGAEKYLGLGTWIIGDDGQPDIDFFGILKAKLTHLGIQRIRLLGCTTGYTQKGRDVVQAIADALGIMVCGTKEQLYAANFTAQGLGGPDRVAMFCCTPGEASPPVERALAPPDFPPAAAPVRLLDLANLPTHEALDLGHLPGVRWPRRALARPLSDTQEADLYGLVGAENRRRGRSLPGLLLAPVHETWIPVGARYRLVQHLFDWHLLRVYSRKLSTVPIPADAAHFKITNPYDSALYRVAEPDRLKRMLIELPGTPVPILERPR